MRLDAVTLKQLRALRMVEKTRSLTEAAQLLHQTPPTIHSQIKNLESLVGGPVLPTAPASSPPASARSW